MGPFLIFSWILDGFRFLFSQFSMVAVSYIFHIFFRKAQVHLNNKKILIFLLITTLLLSDLNEFFCELSAFGHLFEYFIHFLVVNKKNRFLFWKIQWVVVSYDWRIWWVVSYKSVSYRKGMRVCPIDLLPKDSDFF